MSNQGGTRRTQSFPGTGRFPPPCRGHYGGQASDTQISQHEEDLASGIRAPVIHTRPPRRRVGSSAARASIPQ
jgi:hypothetical protein